MEERLKNKLVYLYGMAEKYSKLNKKTHYKYLYRENGINAEIEALENFRDNVTSEWDEAYKEDLRESNI